MSRDTGHKRSAVDGAADGATNGAVNSAVVNALADIASEQWNSLNNRRSPFLSHEFLSALESSGCLGQEYGWFPHHFAAWENDCLQSAIPAYLKANSYGEFVFDDYWAQAYDAAGGSYYPKLVSAIPYTPVSGERLLGGDEAAKLALIDEMIASARENNLSSIHWLFHTESDKKLFEQTSCIARLGCQYHWHNADYSSFDDFLETLTSKKRKMIRRERRLVHKQDIECQAFDGGEVPDEWWQAIAKLYREIYMRKWGVPTFNEKFFRAVAKMLPKNIVIIAAMRRGKLIACAICYRDERALYGRHWGCDDYYPELHFETCYYAGIEYCIRQNLKCFEPGAQGEHKIWRGFLPTPVWSSHWINHAGFERSVREYCMRETEMMHKQIKELFKVFSPYRNDSIPPTQRIFADEHSVD